MAIDWTTIPEKDINNGMDQNSAENQIPAGYAELLENIDTTKKGLLAKRKGYQGVGGYIPLRAKTFSHNTITLPDNTDVEEVCISFDESIQFKSLRSGPIVFGGKTQSVTPLLNGYGFLYAEAYKVGGRKTVEADSAGNFFVSEQEHGIDNYIDGIYYPFFIDTFLQTNEEELSNLKVLPEYAKMVGGGSSTANFYLENSSNTAQTFFYAVNFKAPQEGKTYWLKDASIPQGNPPILTIPSTAHSLQTLSIGVRVFELGEEITTNVTTIVTSTGDIQLEFSEEATQNGLYNIDVCVFEIPENQAVAGNVPANASTSVAFSYVDSPFVDTHIYIETFAGNSLQYEKVIPEEVTADAETGIITASFVNYTEEDVNYIVRYDYTFPKLNTICCYFDVIENISQFESSPEITVWGIPHENLYSPTAGNRAGWVRELATYTSPEKTELVCSLGGNLFKENKNADSEFLFAKAYPNLSTRTQGTHRIGPRFCGKYNPHERKIGISISDDVLKGTFSFTGGEEHWAKVEKIEAQDNNIMRYTLSLPGVEILDASTPPVFPCSEPGQQDGDLLTVFGTGYKRNEGKFEILNYTFDAPNEQLIIDVHRPDITDGVWDEQETGAKAGIFTDYIVTSPTLRFLPEDILLTREIKEEDNITCLKTIFVPGKALTVSLIQNVESPKYLAASEYITAKRTNDLLPLRNSNGFESVSTFVPGDMIAVSGYGRLLRVKEVYPFGDIGVTITGNEEEGKVTVTVPSFRDISSLKTGSKINLTLAGRYEGTHSVKDIVAENKFTIEAVPKPTPDTNVSILCNLVGQSILLDEPVTLQDSANNTISVSTASRWTPIEAPVASASGQDLVSNILYPTHFDTDSYTTQNKITSTLINKSLYLTNNRDEVLKYDGINLYRAGVPWWSPDIVLNAAAENNGPVQVKTPFVTFTDFSNPNNDSNFSIKVDGLIPEINQTFQFFDDSSPRALLYEAFVVDVKTETDQPTEVTLETIDGSIPPTTATVFRDGKTTFNYYVRLDMFDVNNKNSIVGSAATASVTIKQNSRIYMRISSFPTIDLLDHDRLQLKIYRTKANEPGTYYEVGTKNIRFNQSSGYIDFVDDVTDEALFDVDTAMEAVVSGELGQAASGPDKAKYITTIQNRLVLANTTEYPKFEVDVLDGLLKAGDRFLFITDAPTNYVYEFIDDTNSIEYSPAALSTGPGYINVTVNEALPVGATHIWLYVGKPGILTGTPANTDNGPWGWHWAEVLGSNQVRLYTDWEAPSANIRLWSTQFPGSFVPVPLVTLDDADVIDFGLEIEQVKNAQAIKNFVKAVNATARAREDWPKIFAHPGVSRGEQFFAQVYDKQNYAFRYVPSPSNNIQIVCNNANCVFPEKVNAVAERQPSRVIVSAPNYPEYFNNLTSANPEESGFWVDVNPADGQEITAIIPSYGDSPFADSSREGYLVVAKEHAFYLLNPETKEVTQLETQGLGCTYPGSLQYTKGGIVFANDAGVYRLTGQTVEYIGENVERFWEDRVDKNDTELVAGFNDTVNQTYLLTYPEKNNATQLNALVYSFNKEGYAARGLGAWSVFTPYPALQWTFIKDNSYFSTPNGQIMSVRKAGDASDYRDDDQAIEATITLRALHFGDSSIRKYLSSIFLHIRNEFPSTGTKVFVATDLSNNFIELDRFESKGKEITSGIDDRGTPRVLSIRFSTKKSKFLYLQNKIVNVIKDEGLELTMLEYRLAGLSSAGTTEASRTTGR